MKWGNVNMDVENNVNAGYEGSDAMQQSGAPDASSGGGNGKFTLLVVVLCVVLGAASFFGTLAFLFGDQFIPYITGALNEQQEVEEQQYSEVSDFQVDLDDLYVFEFDGVQYGAAVVTWYQHSETVLPTMGLRQMNASGNLTVLRDGWTEFEAWCADNPDEQLAQMHLERMGYDQVYLDSPMQRVQVVQLVSADQPVIMGIGVDDFTSGEHAYSERATVEIPAADMVQVDDHHE